MILRELPQWLEADDPTAAAKEIVSILNLGKTATEPREESRISEAKKGEFVIPGLGKLVKQKRKARIGRHPATGEEIKIPGKTVPKFRVTKPAKDALPSAKK